VAPAECYRHFCRGGDDLNSGKQDPGQTDGGVKGPRAGSLPESCLGCDSVRQGHCHRKNDLVVPVHVFPTCGMETEGRVQRDGVHDTHCMLNVNQGSGIMTITATVQKRLPLSCHLTEPSNSPDHTE
jgi:hypothetical protein